MKYSHRYMGVKGIIAFLCILAGFCSDAFGQNDSAEKEYKEIVVYDADKDGLKPLRNITAGWMKNSDYTPEVRIVETPDGKLAQYEFKGTQGLAISRIYCDKIVEEQVASGMIIEGIKVSIDYSHDDAGKIVFMCYSKSGRLAPTIGLKQGTHDYILRRTQSHKTSFEWNLLQNISLWSYPREGFAKEFRLKSISILVAPEAKDEKVLKVDFIRPVQEVLSMSSPLDDNGDFMRKSWNDTSVLKLSDGKNSGLVTARVGYDNKDLFFYIDAIFPGNPRSTVKEKDREIWQDEALELWFTGRNTQYDTTRRIQFATNSDGYIFDYLVDFDATAARVVKQQSWDLVCKKKLSYADGKMSYEFAFPLSLIKTDTESLPFIGFNIMQNYDKSNSLGVRAQRWAIHPTITFKSFPNIFTCGFLVLNKKPFGSGEMNLGKIRRTQAHSPDKCHIHVQLDMNGFAPGDYEYSSWLIAPDDSMLTQNSKLSITQNMTTTFFIPNAKNLNGTYTWILGVKNRAQDTKLFAVNFINETEIIDLTGETFIWPRPKKAQWHNNRFFNAGEKSTIAIPENASERTTLTAEMFKGKLLDFAGRDFTITKGVDADIILKTAEYVNIKGENEKLKPEGYHLKITPDKVEITGADEAGLFYGTISFMQILKSPMQRRDKAPVKCGEILDWPDLEHRLANTSFLPDQIGGRVEEKTELAFFLDWIERFVVGNKFNVFGIHADTMTVFKRRPEVNYNLENRHFTLEDWKTIADFCRERFVKMKIALPAGGHDNFIGRVRPEFREKGWHDQGNVSHPDYFPMYSDCVLDIIEATNCEFFSPKLDEWWHKRIENEVPDELVYGKTRDQVMLEFVVKLHEFLKKHNVKMMISEDMLNPFHNGKRYDAYTIIDKIPKDVIIAPWIWYGGVAQTSDYFNKRGFKLWGHGTAFMTIPDVNTKKMYSGFGNSIFGWWGGGIHPSAGEQAMFQWMASWFRGADYSWNFFQGNESSVNDEINSGVIPALSSIFALNSNRHASEKIIPLDIKHALTESLNKFMKSYWSEDYRNCDAPVDLPQGETRIANIPVQLYAGNNCVIIDNGQSVDFPVSGKFSSFIFMHSVIDVKNPRKEFAGIRGYRTWHHGWPLGTYIIKYADGTKASFRVNLGLHIYWLRSRPLGGSTLLNRYVYHPLDANGKNIFIYQSEWTNPFPEKQVVGISFVDEKRIPLKTAIFSISGRLPKIEK
ncbi:MAG: hypothetical protein JXR78_09810 [Victivallales bacterium]|nr:hypothetical protein [Victivallales bacterium]